MSPDRPVTITISGGLKAILPDIEEHACLEAGPGMTVTDVLAALRINPLVVTIVAVNGEIRAKDYPLKPGDQIHLVGPAAGG